MRKPIFNKQYFKDARRQLRKESTKEEGLFWLEVRSSKLGYKFKRQESIGKYIVDFYCPKKKLAIELDGHHHECEREYDEERTRYLHEFGITVMRFSNEEVNLNITKVLDKVRQTLSCIYPVF